MLLPKAHRNVSNDTHPVIFFDLAVNDTPLPDRVVVELFTTTAPVIGEHLRKLFTGEIRKRDTPVGFKGSKFTRVIPSTLLHCSEIDTGVGLQREVLDTLTDKSHSTEYTPGLMVIPLDDIALGNNFQFYITLDNPSWITSTHLIVGRVLEGFPTLKTIEHTPIDAQTYTPTQTIHITQCGEM